MLTDAERLQMTAIALMQHNVVVVEKEAEIAIKRTMEGAKMIMVQPKLMEVFYDN